jgi:hypothetical protein
MVDAGTVCRWRHEKWRTRVCLNHPVRKNTIQELQGLHNIENFEFGRIEKIPRIGYSLEGIDYRYDNSNSTRNTVASKFHSRRSSRPNRILTTRFFGSLVNVNEVVKNGSCVQYTEFRSVFDGLINQGVKNGACVHYTDFHSVSDRLVEGRAETSFVNME